MLMLWICSVKVFSNLYHCIAIPGEILQIITHRRTVGQMGEFNGIFFLKLLLQSIASLTLNNPFGIGTLSLALIVVPIIGMHYVHKYGWQHWAPFDSHH